MEHKFTNNKVQDNEFIFCVNSQTGNIIKPILYQNVNVRSSLYVETTANPGCPRGGALTHRKLHENEKKTIGPREGAHPWRT